MNASIVLLYYKDPHLTDRALGSIRSRAPGVEHEVILVCNRYDAEIEAVIERHRVEKHCRLSANFGFSRGNNIGFQMAEGEFCCIFNDDLEVTTGGWLARLLAPFADPEIGATGVEVNRITYIRERCSSRRAADLGYTRAQLVKAGYPLYVVGCLAAYRTRDLHLVGGFDPVFTPCSWEDVDLCYRLDHMLGRKIALADGIGWDHPYRVSQGTGTVEYMGRTEEVAAIAARNQRTGYDRWFNVANQ